MPRIENNVTPRFKIEDIPKDQIREYAQVRLPGCLQVYLNKMIEEIGENEVKHILSIFLCQNG